MTDNVVVPASSVKVVYTNKRTKPKEPKEPKPRRVWDNYVVVGEVQKSASIKIQLAAAVRNGIKYLNVREFYKKKTEEVWKPGRDGITIPLLFPLENGQTIIKPYEDLIKLLEATAETLEDIELYDEANAVLYVKKEKAQ